MCLEGGGFRKSASRDYTKTKVDGGRRVGQSADADVVDASLGIEANILQIDAAGGFERDAPRMAADALHTGAHQVGRHVVEQHRFAAVLQSFLELGHGAALDLYRLLAATVAMGALERLRHAARHGDVIVLDEHAIGEIEAVVVSATAGDG